MTRAMSRVVAMVATTLAISVIAPAAAGARTISDVQAEAVRIAQQIQVNGDRIAALGEQYNGAVLQLRQLEADQARATRQFQRVEEQARSMHGSVVALAARLYMSQSAGTAAIASIDVANAADYLRRQQYTAAAASKDLDLLDRLRVVQSDLDRQRRSLDRSISAARAQRDRLNASRQQIQAANATEAQLLNQTKGELGRLIHAEQQRQLAAQEAAAKARAAADAARQAASVHAPATVQGPQGPTTPLPPARRRHHASPPSSPTPAPS